MKRLVILSCIILTLAGLSAAAEDCGCPDDAIAYEHMFCEKCSTCDKVIIKIWKT